MKAILPLLLALMLAAVRAEDITTTTGHEYKNVTISRTEPDGIVLVHSAGIVKIPFTELPPELQRKYGYNPQAAAIYREQVDRAAAEREAAVAAAKEKQRLFNLSGVTPTAAPSAPERHSLSLARIAPDRSIKLDRVFADYDKNQLYADRQYKGQTFTTSAVIQGIKSGKDGPVVELDVPCRYGGACFAYAYFLPSEVDQLEQFRAGNNLTFVGTIAGFSGYTLTIKSCYLPR